MVGLGSPEENVVLFNLNCKREVCMPAWLGLLKLFVMGSHAVPQNLLLAQHLRDDLLEYSKLVSTPAKWGPTVSRPPPKRQTGCLQPGRECQAVEALSHHDAYNLYKFCPTRCCKLHMLGVSFEHVMMSRTINLDMLKFLSKY